jgi:hypothetical protein
MLGHQIELNEIFTEDLYSVLLVTLALKTVVSISQNGVNQITLNKQIGSHLNRHIINASTHLSWSLRSLGWSRWNRLDNFGANAFLRTVGDQTLGAMDLLNLKRLETESMQQLLNETVSINAELVTPLVIKYVYFIFNNMLANA